jgi:hypothetical protein
MERVFRRICFPCWDCSPASDAISFPTKIGNGLNRVVILTDDMWNAQFNADPKIIGKAILLNGYSFLVVGGLPAGSYFPKPDQLYATPIAGFASPLQYFVPLGLDSDEMKPGVSMHNFLPIGRFVRKQF